MFRLALHWQILITMILGAVIGIALNSSSGTRTTDDLGAIEAGAIQLHGMSAPAKYRSSKVWFHDSPNLILMQISEASEDGQSSVLRRIEVRSPAELSEIDASLWPALPAGTTVPKPLKVAALAKLKPKDAAAYALFQTYGRSKSRWVGDNCKKIGSLFLRMLKMVSIPLIITSLLTGILGLGKAERLGRMFSRTMVYYIATSMLAITTGLIMVNVLKPGVREQATPAAAEAADQAEAADGDAVAPKKKPRAGKGLGTVLFEQVENLIPGNPFKSVAGGNFLSIIAFSLAFGVFTILVGGKTAETISNLAQASFEVMMKMTMAIIALAPVGVFFLMLSVTASQGVDIFGSLGKYMLTVACALLFHSVITMPIILKFVAKRNPLEYAKAMSPALLTAFSSASSNATLPLTLTCAEQRAGISNRTSSFVLPLGATINMDGTALYEVVAVLFIAQFTPGVDLTMTEQIIVAITALLASIGAAGIPHAGLVMMVIILQAVNLPTESQGLIIAVDRVLDMCRTSVNVWSDSCGCAVVQRLTGESTSSS